MNIFNFKGALARLFNFKGALALLDDEFDYLLKEFGASLQQKKKKRR